MENKFNLSKYIKYAQTASDGPVHGNIKQIKTNDARPSGSGPVDAAPSNSSLDIREAVSKAKTIYTEYGNDKKTADMTVENEIRSKLSQEDKKKFDDEMVFFFSSKYLNNLYQESQDANHSERLKKLIEIYNEEGIDSAEYWVEEEIRNSEPGSYGAAKNMLDAMKGDRFDIGDVSASSTNTIDESINKINKAAADALVRIINNGMITDLMESCGNYVKMLRTPTGKNRFKNAMESFAARKIPLFNRQDLFGVAKDRATTFMSLFISQHSESVRTSNDRIIKGSLHDFVNRHYTLNPNARPLGDSYVGHGGGDTPAEASRRYFDEIDGGLHAHRLSDGKYAFEHMADEFANALSQDPPEQRSLCLVFLKISMLAESQGSAGGRQMSQMGDEDSDAMDVSGKGYSSADVGSSTIPSTTLSDPGQPAEILNAVREKSDQLKNIMSKIAQEAMVELGGNNLVSSYFTGAISRIAASSASLENWLAGNMHIEQLNNGASPSWIRFIDSPRSTQLNKNKAQILETQDFSSLGPAKRIRNIDGIETTFIFDYEKPSSFNMYSSKQFEYTDSSGRKMQVPIPVFKTRFVDIIFKDKLVSPADFTVSAEDKDALTAIAAAMKSSSLLGGVEKTSEQKIEDILNVFKNYPESFIKGAATLKSNISGSTARLAGVIGVGDPEVIEQFRKENGFLTNKNTAPNIEQILELRNLVSTDVYLKLLAAIASRIGQRPKTERNFSNSDERAVTTFVNRMLAQGKISQAEYDAVIKFKAVPQQSTASKRAEEIDAWIKIMTPMIFQ